MSNYAKERALMIVIRSRGVEDTITMVFATQMANGHFDGMMGAELISYARQLASLPFTE